VKIGLTIYSALPMCKLANFVKLEALIASLYKKFVNRVAPAHFNRRCSRDILFPHQNQERNVKVEGHCHCGAVAYEATVDPQTASLCHCTDCQTLSGAPFRASVVALAENFHLLRGQPKIYIKTGESGARRAQAFCAECGTPIYAAAPDSPTQYNLRLGAVAQRAQIPALKQRWCDSALAWTENVASLPATARQ
jgi:hypothetical protein